MSSLFDEAMRAAVFCNASGMAPETDEEAAVRLTREAERLKFCDSELEYSCDGFYCERKRGHRGDHQATDDGEGDTQWEIRWRPK